MLKERFDCWRNKIGWFLANLSLRMTTEDYQEAIMKYMHMGMLADSDLDTRYRLCDLVEKQEGPYFDFLRESGQRNYLFVTKVKHTNDAD